MNSDDRAIDEFLVLEAQRGSRAALATLVARWQPRLLRYALVVAGDKELARDSVQDSWIRIIKALPGLHDPVAFEAWAYRIVGNRSQDLLRQRGRFQALEDAEQAAPELAADLWRELRHLNVRDRTVIALHYLAGFTVQEIGQILRIPAGTAKSRLFKARERFRLTMETQSHERTRREDPLDTAGSHRFRPA